MNSSYLGRLSFEKARILQERLILRRLQGLVADTLLFCEHDPVISCGRRTRDEDFFSTESERTRSLLPRVRSGRGGGPTYHGPGQIVFYPVVSLRKRHLGVRRFVLAGLNSLVRVLRDFNLPLETRLKPAGLWLVGQEAKKIASVGLELVQGVSNHGFALNVSCDLTQFSSFFPCGLRGVKVTSLSEELGDASALWSLQELAAQWAQEFSLELGEQPFNKGLANSGFSYTQ